MNPIEKIQVLFHTMTRITDNLHENLFTFMAVCPRILIPVDARLKAWVCGRSLAGIADSNPAPETWASLCCEVDSPRRAGRTSRGVLPNVVCLSVIMKPQ